MKLSLRRLINLKVKKVAWCTKSEFGLLGNSGTLQRYTTHQICGHQICGHWYTWKSASIRKPTLKIFPSLHPLQNKSAFTSRLYIVQSRMQFCMNQYIYIQHLKNMLLQARGGETQAIIIFSVKHSFITWSYIPDKKWNSCKAVFTMNFDEITTVWPRISIFE